MDTKMPYDMNMSYNMQNFGCNVYGLPTSYKTLQEALKLVKESVTDEKEDELFYDYLISVAPTQEAKNIITSIRNDERKHNKMFRQIYKFYTGENIQAPETVEFKKPKSYIDGIKQAKMGELAAVERYRIIRAGLSYRYFRDMVFEILTDEIKHAAKYDYLLSVYVQSEVEAMKKRNITSTELTRGIDMDEEVELERKEFTPDEWVEYSQPVLDEVLEEYEEGGNLSYLIQESILTGVLVGKGYTPKKAMGQVKMWEILGQSKLLQKSKRQRND